MILILSTASSSSLLLDNRKSPSTLKNSGTSSRSYSVCKCCILHQPHNRQDCLRAGGRTKGGGPLFLARQNDSIKGTSDTWTAVRRWQRRRRGRHRKHPYRRVKGRCWGNGLGSLVTCRHRLLAPRQPAMVGLTYSRAGKKQ